MEKQNITLSIRKDILQKIKIIAVRRDASVSALVSQALEDIVAREEAYTVAQRAHRRLLRDGYELGTYGKATWTRDELHDR